MNISISDKLLYWVAGCGFGLVVGALFAPRSGQETRKNLTSKVDDLTHKVQERIHASGIRETASDTLQSVAQKGKNVASIGSRRRNETIDARKGRFNESLEDDDLFEN